MMTINVGKIRSLMFCLTLAFLAGMSHLAPPAAGAQEQVGLLTVTGRVKVNGKLAATGDIVATGSEIQTAKGSSAVVSLGMLGRVEALPSTTMKLRYGNAVDKSISIWLSDGSVGVSSGEGVDFYVGAGMTSTRPSSRTEQNVFTVDSNCGNTLVSVTKGKVELHTGKGFKEIAAGGQGAAMQAKPGCAPPPTPLIGLQKNSAPIN